SPEFLETFQPVASRIAGNQACVDGADRGADDPVRLDAVLVQRVVDAGVISAERAATLQHQHDLLLTVLPGTTGVRERRDGLAVIHDSPPWFVPRNCTVEGAPGNAGWLRRR